MDGRSIMPLLIAHSSQDGSGDGLSGADGATSLSIKGPAAIDRVPWRTEILYEFWGLGNSKGMCGKFMDAYNNSYAGVHYIASAGSRSSGASSVSTQLVGANLKYTGERWHEI